jgi:hypothetical protein
MHLRLVFTQIARYSTKLSASSQDAISAFKEQYPIALNPNRARKNPFELNLQELSTMEYLSYSLLLWVQHRRSSSWINRIFRGNNDGTYLDGEFLEGAEVAIRSFFKSLNRSFDMEKSDIDAPYLEDISSPELFQAFRMQHTSLQHNMSIDVRLNKLKGIQTGSIWHQFGPPDRVTTTLVKAPMHSLMAPTIGWRYAPENKKWLFREANLEYDLSEDEMSRRTPNNPLRVSERDNLRRLGAIVGIDVHADVNATVFIKAKDNSSQQWVYSIDRDMVFRFQSPHIVTSCTGSWKIVDVDNYFSSELTN